jgi:hypothetical protein
MRFSMLVREIRENATDYRAWQSGNATFFGSRSGRKG